MSITYRPTRPADLETCFSMASDRVAYGAAEERAVGAFWRSLLESRAALSCVVEDHTRPPGKQILGFATSVFVTDEVKEEVKERLFPHIGRQIYLQSRTLRRMFLRREEIARRNSAGDLNLLVLSHGTAPGLPDEVNLRVRARAFEAFLESHRGYAIKEILQETFGRHEVTGAQGLGFQLVRGGRAGVGPSPGAHPDASALMSMRREDCGFPSPMWGFFHPPRPLFQFSDVEKDVLEAALCSGTDEEISRSLEISIWTIKKRWQKVYEKVERVSPSLLQPAQADDEMAAVASITNQRRRHLLDYLRQSPEEIRPTIVAARGRGRSIGGR